MEKVTDPEETIARQIALEHAVSLCEHGKVADHPHDVVVAAEKFLKFLKGHDARL